MHCTLFWVIYKSLCLNVMKKGEIHPWLHQANIIGNSSSQPISQLWFGDYWGLLFCSKYAWLFFISLNQHWTSVIMFKTRFRHLHLDNDDLAWSFCNGPVVGCVKNLFGLPLVWSGLWFILGPLSSQKCLTTSVNIFLYGNDIGVPKHGKENIVGWRHKKFGAYGPKNKWALWVYYAIALAMHVTGIHFANRLVESWDLLSSQG